MNQICAVVVGYSRHSTMVRAYCNIRCTRLGAILEGEYHRASTFSSHAQLGICIVLWCLWRPCATRMLRSSLGEQGQGYDKINTARGMETLPGTAWPSRPRPLLLPSQPAARGSVAHCNNMLALSPSLQYPSHRRRLSPFKDPRTTTSHHIHL